MAAVAQAMAAGMSERARAQSEEMSLARGGAVTERRRGAPAHGVVQACTVVTAALGALLLWAGHYARAMSDDFVYTTLLRQRGFVADQIGWYRGWSGRFSSTFAASLAQHFGLGTGFAVLCLCSALWLGALLWLGCSVARRCGVPRRAALAPALLVLVVTWLATPAIGQALYWQMGLLSYGAPLVLGTAALALGSRGARPGTAAALALAALTFLAGGFSETYALAQTLVLALGLVYALRYAPHALRAVAAGGVGSVVAALIVAAAPGNADRRALAAPVHPWSWVLSHGAAQTVAFLADLAPAALFVLLGTACLVRPWCLRRVRPVRPCMPFVLFLGLVCLVVPLACILAGWREQSVALPGRSLLVPDYVVLGCAAAAGVYLAPRLRSRRGGYVAATLLLLAVVGLAQGTGVAQLRAWLRDAPPYAAAWDARDQALRHPLHGIATIRVLTNPAGLDDLSPRPVNRTLTADVGALYGLRAIRFAPGR